MEDFEQSFWCTKEHSSALLVCRKLIVRMFVIYRDIMIFEINIISSSFSWYCPALVIIKLSHLFQYHFNVIHVYAHFEDAICYLLSFFISLSYFKMKLSLCDACVCPSLRLVTTTHVTNQTNTTAFQSPYVCITCHSY